MELPQSLLEDIVKDNTNDGNVIKVFCNDLKGISKAKILVIVSKSTCGNFYGCVFINSDNYPNVNTTHILKSQQLVAAVSKYKTFLDHDSYFDCSNIQQKTIADINAILKKEPNRMIGKIEIEDHKLISDTLKSNKTLSTKTKKLYYLY